MFSDLSLTVRQGQIVALLGPNGAGKTTLLELVLGALTPAGGQLTVLGMDPSASGDALKARVAVLAQHPADRSIWRVGELLDWVCGHYLAAGRAVADVSQVLQQVGLADAAQKRLENLSGGQRRRVEIAAAMVGRPDLLLLDEPTASLDPQSKAGVHELLMDQLERGATVLLATHDLAEAQKIADRVIVLAAGQVRFDGTVSQLRGRIDGYAEVTWTEGGIRQVHATADVEGFIRTLDMEAITGLEVVRPDLEEAYIDLLGSEESHD